jgi:hypothetical protein
MRTYLYPADIEAEFTFIPTEQGGRQTPAFSGYRPQFFYDEQDWDADQEFPDVESALPGQTVRALLRFASPDSHLGRVHPNMGFFEVREGHVLWLMAESQRYCTLKNRRSELKASDEYVVYPMVRSRLLLLRLIIAAA